MDCPLPFRREGSPFSLTRKLGQSRLALAHFGVQEVSGDAGSSGYACLGSLESPGFGVFLPLIPGSLLTSARGGLKIGPSERRA